MENNPLVTVNILSFNRKDELRITLTKVFEQDYNNIEVIVVDNASTDGSPEMVEKEFPTVILIKLNKNIGVAGWNEGFKIAKGKYLLVLDDDAFPDKPSIKLSVEEMENNLLIGIIAYNVFNILQNNDIRRFPGGWLPDNNIERCNWNYFIGCAFFIRTNLCFDTMVPSKYFICFHELPIVRYVLLNDHKILYNQKIIAYHQNQKLIGPSSLKEYYNFRNQLNFIFWNAGFPYNLFYGLRVILFFSTRSIKNGWFPLYIRAIFYQYRNLQIYKLRRMNNIERQVFFNSEFVEYKILNKIAKYF